MTEPSSTRVLTVDPEPPDASVLDEAARVLAGGGLVAFATETVYGLGADATDPAAVARIFAAKGRPAVNPLIVHVADIGQAGECVADWPDDADRLAARFWPGPLTLVLPPFRPDPRHRHGRQADRRRAMPRGTVARGLIARCGRPLAAPSANRSNRLSPTRAEHVLDDLDGRIDLILDSGPTTVGLESTVLDLTERPAPAAAAGADRRRGTRGRPSPAAPLPYPTRDHRPTSRRAPGRCPSITRRGRRRSGSIPPMSCGTGRTWRRLRSSPSGRILSDSRRPRPRGPARVSRAGVRDAFTTSCMISTRCDRRRSWSSCRPIGPNGWRSGIGSCGRRGRSSNSAVESGEGEIGGESGRRRPVPAMARGARSCRRSRKPLDGHPARTRPSSPSWDAPPCDPPPCRSRDLRDGSAHRARSTGPVGPPERTRMDRPGLSRSRAGSLAERGAATRRRQSERDSRCSMTDPAEAASRRPAPWMRRIWSVGWRARDASIRSVFSLESDVAAHQTNRSHLSSWTPSTGPRRRAVRRVLGPAAPIEAGPTHLMRMPFRAGRRITNDSGRGTRCST